MFADYIYIRCAHCGRVYKTSAGIACDRVSVLLPVLKVIPATCPECQQTSMIGNAEIFVLAPHEPLPGVSGH